MATEFTDEYTLKVISNWMIPRLVVTNRELEAEVWKEWIQLPKEEFDKFPLAEKLKEAKAQQKAKTIPNLYDLNE